MQKYNKARRKGLLNGYAQRYQGILKILSLVSRAEGSGVISHTYAADLIVNEKNI